MIKVDYLRFYGRLESLRVVEQHSDNVQVLMTLNSEVIPNLRIPTQIYEDLEVGGEYEFYGLIKNEKDKVKNEGLVYAVKPAKGEMLVVPSVRYGVQFQNVVKGAIAAIAAFAVSWVAFFFGIAYFFGKHMNMSGLVSSTTTSAFLTAIAVGVFFVGRGFHMLYKTTVLETWPSVTPAKLAGRFSKLHR